MKGRFKKAAQGGALSLLFLISFTPLSNAQAADVTCRELHEAVFLDEPEDVLALIKKGIDVNCLDTLNHTPLITATTGASLESFRVLIRHGAKINVRDEWGQTLIRRIQEGIARYDMQGGETYRTIFRRMADLVEGPEEVN